MFKAEAKDKVKLSKFNFCVENENEVILYNSVTGAIIKLDEENYINRYKSMLEKSTSLIYDPADELIITLFEQGMLVPLDIDENAVVRYNYVKAIIKKPAISFMMIVTRQCNLRCVYCYEKHENLVMEPVVYENMLKCLESKFSSGEVKQAEITFFGGEPLLEYDKIVQFLEEACRIAQKYNCAIGAGMSTNGALLTPDRFEKLCGLNCCGYQITLDGTKEIHDKYRPNANGEGSWEKIIQNL